jgi:hypothetical protein
MLGIGGMGALTTDGTAGIRNLSGNGVDARIPAEKECAPVHPSREPIFFPYLREKRRICKSFLANPTCHGPGRAYFIQVIQTEAGL